MQPQTQIKHVIFDIGNVIVRWAPVEIVRLTFGDSPRAETLAKQIFQSTLWRDINLGKLSEAELKTALQAEFELSALQADMLMYYVKQTQLELYGSVELIKRVKAAGYGVYALSDNVHEIVAFLKQQYDFWPLFDGAVISAEVGYLKPQAEIYQILLENHQLCAKECVFIDDMPHNVEGAKAIGMATIQFENALQCQFELANLGIEV